VTAQFEVAGTCFHYPENWTLIEEPIGAAQQCVTVQSPESGFWMLQVFDASVTPAELAGQVLRSLRQEYEEMEVFEARQRIEATETLGYDVQFYYLDFVVAARLRCFSLRDHTCAVICQAEDREFDRTWPVFLAMLTSLLQDV
jgi:hypothetical protein